MHNLSTRSIVLSSVMLVFIFVAVYCVVAYGFPQDSSCFSKDVTDLEENKVLLSVHAVFRHGQRTPADTYPKDPNINEAFYPFGWGQLTNKGKQEVYDLGRFLRNRYNKFLGNLYEPDYTYAQSTGVSRTKMTLQLVLAGLWPPRNTALEWNRSLNFQPIPYEYEPLDQDTFLLVRSCPRYQEELSRTLSEEPEIVKAFKENSQLFREISNYTGLVIKNFDDVQSLYSTLKAEEDFGIKLQRWTKRYYPERLLQLTEQSYIYNVYNDELKKLKGGPFLTRMLNQWKSWKDASPSTKQPKIYLYAGHDSTVVNALSAFKIWKKQFPGYGITGIFELYQDKTSKEYGVKTFLRTGGTPEPLIIPGCEEYCPLTKLESLVNNMIISNLKTDCVAINEDFTEPPFTGP